MNIKIKVKIEVEVTTLLLDAGVRYWEDAIVNGVEDTEEGDNIPCRNGDSWCPQIDINTGIITNWEKGKTADIHYKVCDDGRYYLLDSLGGIVLSLDGYVPKILDLSGEGFGDYIIMTVDTDGKIANWNNKPDIEEFKEG